MSKYLPDKQKTNLPAIRAAFDALEDDMDAIRAMIEAIPATELPDDLATKSDIPEPPDLVPICTRVDELTVVMDKLADIIPDEASIQTIADARAGAKVGPVKGRLTQLWNDLAEEKNRIDAIEATLPGIRDAAQTAASRQCPEPPDVVDVPPIRADIDALAARIDAADHAIKNLSAAANSDDTRDMVDAVAVAQKALREDLTETRRWLADMGKAWQRHKAEVRGIVDELPDSLPAPTMVDDTAIEGLRADITHVKADLACMADRIPSVAGLAGIADIPDVSGLRAELDGLRTAVQAISSRSCPSVDLSAIESRLSAIEHRQCPVVDVTTIMSRLDALESRQCPDVPATQNLEPIMASINTLETRIDEITGGDA